MLGERIRDLPDRPLEDTAEPASRELTVEDAFNVALELQKVDRLAEAGVIYARILEADPGHAQAVHYSGVLAYQAGRDEDGISLIEKSLALVPDVADWHSNFGLVLQARGRFEEAIAAYRRAIALDSGHANAYSNLGVLLRATDRPVEAEASYRTAIRLNPDHIDAYTNLGILLNGLKRSEESVACFCKVITLRPKHREARRLLALAHCTLGEVEKAIDIFEEWLAEDPNDPIALHMLSACTGRDIPGRASDGYVEQTFDSFAASFESKLARLSYRAPALVAAMLEDSGTAPAKTLDVLDAGCGTGLCGPLVLPYARRLTGVDLSAGMLTQAKEKQAYDELLQTELTGYLRDHQDAFDLIVSADTLVYFGALDEVVAASAGALRVGGLLIFTVEDARDAAAEYRLELHGRYVHGRSYVERLLTGAGLTPEIVHADLRMESGAPVAGLVVSGRKACAAAG
jgi:predicted TPR repeat methyltransferase